MAEELMELHNVLLKKVKKKSPDFDCFGNACFESVGLALSDLPVISPVSDCDDDMSGLFHGNVTPEELQVFVSIKSKAVRDFSIGAAASSLLAWAATRRLNPVIRISLSGGAGATFGLWAFSRSFNSCIENILSLEGSRMQNELAKIVVRKYHRDPSRIQQISRHFYAEQVFDDSASDLPKLRWRYRSFFSDSSAAMQRNQDNDDQHGNNDQPYGGANSQNPHNNISDNLENKSNASNGDSDFKGAVKSKGDSVNLGTDMMGDPLDCVFGPTSMEEVIHISGNKRGERRATPHRKSRRKHRMRQKEAVADVLHA
ncbi:hypothetical protein MLD38_011997 [Melastoma candidum]|uniref:Uncharacterized protein n=1 Tax=Melastoma candidum TaxID=119954 RepID=A0ACB9R5H7_9MYRT|nr:hypothetical protein MLD38_011997 [Melastoma candidum]